ncbi:MAG: type II and III secretion system protein family protein [Rhodospirillales bacterium]|jgi:pilus assembly protein CpaC|nr:type II and III secretion system protein family protein [Rhodospirillales bacterium]
MQTPRNTFNRRPHSGLLGVFVIVSVILTAFVVSPAGSFDVVGAGNTLLNIERNRGRLVRLDGPASTVFIANPEIADVQVKSPSLIYLMGKQPGQTTLFAVDEAERVLANIDISVTHNIEHLRRAVRDLHPNSDISVASIDQSIVIEGTVETATMAENLRRLVERFAGSPEAVINRLGVTSPSQVNLRVRVAEVSREVDKQFGLNWNVIGSIGGLAIGMTTANPFASVVTPDTFSLGGSPTNNWDLNVIVDALEDEGLVKVLAEPNLTALSGETASFLAGGEFPILVPDADGRVTIEFKKFSVSLAFTPTLIGDGLVNLHVRPEVSQLSSSNAVTLNSFQIPSLITRRAETTVELGSGQSFAIAGLLQNNVTHDISKFPGLGDVPVLGSLFRSDRFQRAESELVIIVTPYVVRPTSKAKLSAPTDGFASPSDYDRVVTGGTHRRNATIGKPRTVTPDGAALIGPVGFQLD